MAGIQSVKLELLRAGPIHNQLLSPLTPYLVLCGDEAPVTVNIELEQRELQNRLERLRYIESGGRLATATAISDKTREAEVMELGSIVGRILGRIPTLSSELARTETNGNGIIHLRVVLSGSELALIPFELSTSPQGLPGEGLPLLLQRSVPIAMTREVRRGRPMKVEWDRKPRILFVSAATGSSTVPAQAHLQAIREALEPWVRWEATPEKRVHFLSDHLTLLNNASLEDIRKACSESDYTHVHVLAHGASFEEAGETRWGVALCAQNDRSRPDVVDGKRLAQALQATKEDGGTSSPPAVVTLMTCDSGNVGSLLIPGGSIAHDLQAYGIPWVLASQFPLTKQGSVTITSLLYSRLLRGDDPRQTIHELRHRLKTDSNSNHDWASLVAYAALPPDFERQVTAFRDRQRQKAIDVAFDKAERGGPKETEESFQQVTTRLDRWEREFSSGQRLADRMEQARCYGLRGASAKRAAQIRFGRDDLAKAGAQLEEARGWYERAMKLDPNNHWTATQLLSLCSILQQPTEGDWWALARSNANKDLAGPTSESIAWAHSSLAELEMLAAARTDETKDRAQLKEHVLDHCKAIVDLMGKGSFPVFSTLRQFQRYVKWWDRAEWREIATAVVEFLKPFTESTNALPPDEKDEK